MTFHMFCKLVRNVNRSDGPPPFVPFGQRIKKEQVQELSGQYLFYIGNSTVHSTHSETTQ